MNLEKLFETQKVLDAAIIKKKGLEGRDMLPEKILALQVELGELANEWRGFKFWSEDREPRTHYVEGGMTYGTFRNPLLEEYVDCLHFILSIGLGLNMQHVELAIDSDYTRSTAIKTFNQLYRVVAELETRAELGGRDDLVDLYEILLNLFVGVGEKFLGFTVDEIESAYFAMNEINHERQRSGY